MTERRATSKPLIERVFLNLRGRLLRAPVDDPRTPLRASCLTRRRGDSPFHLLGRDRSGIRVTMIATWSGAPISIIAPSPGFEARRS